MGRKRTSNVRLPKDVQKVTKRNGRVYYYFAPKRGTKIAGKRVALGSDDNDPEFWRRLRDARRPQQICDGSLAALIAEFKRSQAFINLRPASQRGYSHFLDRLEAEGGDRPVSAMTRRDVYSLLDSMSITPVAANYMLSVLRTLLEFGVPRGYRDDNPAIGVRRLKVDDSGHAPWPEPGYSFVMQHAPLHLRRMAFLGRATGQRVSDLVKMRASDMVEDGIKLRIGKLRDKPHIVPLTRAQMAEIRSWDVSDLEYLITTPKIGKRCSESYLNQLWNGWRETEEATPISDLKMTIHGLRATAIRDRRRAGASDGEIADELGMSVKMVSRYLRFDDKVAAARASRDRREQKMTGFENSGTYLKTGNR